MTYSDSGRGQVVEALREELLGPSRTDGATRPSIALSLEQPLVFESAASVKGPFHDAETGEEILFRDTPMRRYGVGVLYPRKQTVEGEAHVVESSQQAASASDDDSSELEAFLDEPDEAQANPDVPEVDGATRVGDAEDDDFGLTASTQLRPSALGVSFLARTEPTDEILVRVTGGRYEPRDVLVDGKTRRWWVRRPVELTAVCPGPSKAGLQPVSMVGTSDPLKLTVNVLARQHASGCWLITIAMVNNAPTNASADEMSLFQTRFEVSPTRGGVPLPCIEPYPDRSSERLLERDAEARSLDLLYRKAPVFGVGHGCAATWPEKWGAERCEMLVADVLPTFETPSITPDITLPDGSKLAVPLGPLAGLDEDDDGFAGVADVVNAYGDWVDSLEQQLEELEGRRYVTAQSHIAICRRMHERMTAGMVWLRDDPTARRAFVLANRAVLFAQLRSDMEAREITVTKNGPAAIADGTPIKDWRSADRRWRAFQIGFILAAARSTVLDESQDEDRQTVELIFFPTGGGKTEAYQGLAAFSLFHQRLAGRQTGVSVLMRYTLRLLTSQQFLRAATLMCSMEFIREQEGLEGTPFSIGMWVGGSTSPLTRQEAIAAWRRLARDAQADNPFVVTQCPWCATKLGPIRAMGGRRGDVHVLGYRNVHGAIVFHCPDRHCAFNDRLPIYVVDEDVYDHRPSIVIGTIDKFAMLAFRPEARSLFGLDSDGLRVIDPPNLIIQDELHLISGPLGSMAGMYETIIEDLCTDHRFDPPRRPKIVSSTATIRRFAEQVKGLYARSSTALFPPHGLDARDSFFARVAIDPATGEQAQGRMYVGVHAPGLGSSQTVQVRVASSLLTVAPELPESDQDPWWSLMAFYNSLRELGGAVSLVQSDIPGYLKTIANRHGVEFAGLRRLNRSIELTSRLTGDEIPKMLRALEQKSSAQYPVDVCLASNIIEVGVDVPRLSLLMVVGQPKSTSQYIQVSGRVGRRWESRPGLVVTVYGASKPRDRSHFERFQSYHQRLYAEVEPVSVTPFAPPVVERALHAAAIAHIRQTAVQNLAPSPLPDEFETVAQLFLDRVERVDPDEVLSVKSMISRRRGEWVAREPDTWEIRPGNEGGPLMRRAGEYVPPEIERRTWAVPMSLRNVDAECRSEVTDRYMQQRAAGAVEEDS